MGLETVTYISDLVATNPVGATDQKAQGDDHLRNIKTGLLNTFASFVGAAVTLTEAQINDAALKSASQTVSGSWTFTANPTISKANPVSILKDTSGGASDMTAFLSYQDAAGNERGYVGFGAGTTVMTLSNYIGQLTIAGNGEIELNAATIDINGAVDISGATTIAGLATFNTSPQINATQLNIYPGATNYEIVNRNAGGFWFYTESGVNIPLKLTNAEIELNATLLDFNGPADISGELLVHDFLAVQGSYNASMTGVHGWIDVNGGVARHGAATTSGARAAMGLWGASLDIDMNGGGIDFNSEPVTRNDTLATEVGYAGAPSRDVASAGNTAAADQGKTIRLTASGFTFTLDGDPPEDAVVIIDNAGGGANTIAASGTLIWATTGGTGNRTIADDGLAVAIHRGSGVWVINGGGLT